MRRFAKLLLLTVLLFGAHQAHAAIARDTGSMASTTCASASSQTLSVNVAAAGETLVAYGYVEGGLTLTAAFNGSSMTEVKNEAMHYTPTHRFYMWVLPNASSGTHNLVFTNSSISYMCGYAVAYSGVYTGGPTYGAQSTHSSGNSSSVSVNVTTTAVNDWIVGAGRIDNAGTYSGTGSFTLLGGAPWGDGGNVAGDTNGAVSVGSNAVGFSNTNAGGTVLVAAALTASTTTPPSSDKGTVIFFQ
jgi:hypothetical protein